MISTRNPGDIGQWLRNAARTPDQHERRIDHLDELVGLLVVREMFKLEGVELLSDKSRAEIQQDLDAELESLLALIGQVSAAEFMYMDEEVH
jgi:hypothetical protein